jgi:hypothetical protein
MSQRQDSVLQTIADGATLVFGVGMLAVLPALIVADILTNGPGAETPSQGQESKQDED